MIWVLRLRRLVPDRRAAALLKMTGSVKSCATGPEKWRVMFFRIENLMCCGSTRARRSKRSAFTLVELLVVIGIIALLISILLPALSKAQQQAKMTVCMSNMRALGQAVAIYQSENKGAFPPLATTYQITGQMDAPHIWSLLSIPVQSNVRFCPTAAEGLPFQDLSGPNNDGNPCYTTRTHVSYMYNRLLGGLDNHKNGPWQATGSGSATDPIRPCTYRSIPASSETLLFMDYPGLVVVCVGYESSGMDRGIINDYTDCAAPNLQNLVTMPSGVKELHQVFYSVAPVHFRKPAMGPGFKNLTAAGISPRATQGLINVGYCDGSVRSVFVRQAPVGAPTGATITKYDVALFTLDMTTRNGAGLWGAEAPIPGTRYNPFVPW
jgi:prepilin-type N-terminal cleavage/methylation domain-containing protein